jgi:hypothetical protein
MATSFINDPEHWRNRAEETRTIAEQMNDEASDQGEVASGAVAVANPHTVQRGTALPVWLPRRGIQRPCN